MLKKKSSNQPCGRESEYITGVFLKSFSIVIIIGIIIGLDTVCTDKAN